MKNDSGCEVDQEDTVSDVDSQALFVYFLYLAWESIDGVGGLLSFGASTRNRHEVHLQELLSLLLMIHFSYFFIDSKMLDH